MNFSIFTQSRNSFEGQLPDEKTLFVIRMHWFAIAQEGIVLFLMVIPIIAALFWAELLVGGVVLKFVTVLASLLLLYWWYGVFFVASMYYLNTWIVTDHRLIESRQLGLFRRNYTEINLAKIQDISVAVEGFFETMLSFGMLEVQSAAAEKKFKMINISNPLVVKEGIMKAYNRFAKTHPGGFEEENP